jgi:hypothetical protein
MNPSNHKSLRHQLRRAESADDFVHLLKTLARTRRAHGRRVVARQLDVRALITTAALQH